MIDEQDLSQTGGAAVYGFPPAGLADAMGVQTSPLVPGAAALEALPGAGLARFTVLAPPGTLERRYALAQALRALRPGGELTALAAKDKGGSRLRGELEGLGCVVVESAKQHHRICHVSRPAVLDGLDDAIAAGGPRLVEGLGLWSQPGLFGWDRIDPGSRLLADTLPQLAGRGADLGCGIGYLAQRVLAMPLVTGLELVDIDRRAIEACARNIDDPRAPRRWTDLRSDMAGLADLEFAVTNPPFHDTGREDQSLGAAFIAAAARALRPQGVLWLVANRHLPYEAPLRAAFAQVELKVEASGYKVFEAIKDKAHIKRKPPRKDRPDVKGEFERGPRPERSGKPR